LSVNPSRFPTKYEAIGDDYAAWRAAHFEDADYRPLFERIPQPCGLAVDVGCGGGLLAGKLAARARRVVALDTSWRMLLVARRHLAGLGKGNVWLVMADMCRPPLRDGSAQFVLSVNSLHHTSLDASLPALAAVLSEGGWLVARDFVRSFPRLAKSVPVKFLKSLGWLARCVAKDGLREGLRSGSFFIDRRWLRPESRLKLTPVEFSHSSARLLPGSLVVRLRHRVVHLLWERPPAPASPPARYEYQ
jgi:SAM-dependent methyltransferase